MSKCQACNQKILGSNPQTEFARIYFELPLNLHWVGIGSTLWFLYDTHLINIFTGRWYCNRHHHCQTIHPKKYIISMNLFKISLNSEVMVAVRGQKPTSWHLTHSAISPILEPRPKVLISSPIEYISCLYWFFRFILKLKSDLVKSDLDPTILIENFDHVTVKSLIKYLYYDSGNMDCRVSERGIKN